MTGETPIPQEGQNNHKVIIAIGETKFNVFLEPDICMLFEDRFPEQIGELEQGKIIHLEFAESYRLIIKFVPINNEIKCYSKELSCSTEERIFILNKQQVLDELRRFLTELMELAVNPTKNESRVGIAATKL